MAKINRREAIGWLGSCLLVPSLRLLSGQPERKPPPIELADFCADCVYHRGSKKLDFRAPFLQSGWTYATDGSVAIRISADQEQGQRAIAHLPEVGALPYWQLESGRWRNWPPRRWIEHPRCDWCPICEGTGYLRPRKDCPRCNGWGGCGWEGGAELPCEICRGSGYAGHKCPYCDGSGHAAGRPTVQQVGPAAISGRYDLILRKLPDLRWQPASGAGPAELLPLRFRFSGGDGLLMPLDLTR